MRSEKKHFSLTDRGNSFIHAGRGVWVFIQTTHNAWVQSLILAVAILFGFYCDISRSDWIMLVLAAGLVLVAEAINTAIEIDINLTSPEFHPYARDTKDVAAGAVLIASVVALVIGLMIFIPPIQQLLTTDYYAE